MTTDVKNIILFPLNLLYRVSPSATLKILFRLKNGYRLNLKNPRTYNEKLQWIKLNYKNPLITKLVDKYTVREFVDENAPELLTRLLWHGFDAKEIPWDDLPEKFVIKVTHGSGFNIICKNKSELNKDECEKKLNKWLKEKFLRCYGEWFYGVEKPRIIIEEFLDDGTNKEPVDYKFLCFDGIPRYIRVDTNRFTEHKTTIYDTEWHRMEEVSIDYPIDKDIPRPQNLESMLKYASHLSKGFPHVRVDLYDINGRSYFGEMTFTNGAGFDQIKPYEFDLKLGEFLVLPREE